MTAVPFAALCLLASVSAMAQSAADPQYFVSMGGGYVKNASPNAATGWVSAAVGIGGGNYSISTVDMTAATTTIRTGFGRVFARSGNFTLMGRIDAGITTVTPTVGSFSGGGMLLYNLKALSVKLDGVHVLAELRISGVTAASATVPNQVVPGFYFGVGKSF